MSERTRFHPAYVLVEIFKRLRNTFLIVLYVLISSNVWFALGLLAALIILFSLIALIKYYTQGYQITPDKLILYRGVLNRKEVDIPYDRIQTIKKRQWFFFKPFGVIQLLIETAGGQGDKAEADFPAVKEDVLTTIEQHRSHQAVTAKTEQDTHTEAVEMIDNSGVDHNHSAQPPSETVENPRYSHIVSDGQIVLFSLTDLSIVALLLAFLTFADDFVPSDWLHSVSNYTNELLTQSIWLAVGLSVIVLLLLSLFSIARNFFRYYNFKSSRTDHYVVIEKGLFERSTQTIPIAKIQGIKVKQQILRKLLGLTSVELLLAGGQATENSEGDDATFYLLPIVREKELQTVLASLLPEWDLTNSGIAYTSRKQLWYFFRWYLLTIPVIIVAAYFHKWIAMILVLLTALGLISSWLDCRFQGYAITNKEVLCTQHYLFLTNIRTYVKHTKIQAFCKRTTPWLYRKGLGHFELWVKVGTDATTVNLRFVDQKVIKQIETFYRTKSSLI